MCVTLTARVMSWTFASAILSLSARSLGGSIRQIEVTPETTLGEIRSRLEAEFPAYHKVHLLELHDQAEQCPERALTDLEWCADQEDSYLSECFRFPCGPSMERVDK